MQVRVRVADGSVDESRSLFTWLRDEPRVRRHGEPTVPDGGSAVPYSEPTVPDGEPTVPDGDAGPGHMGTSLEVLGLVLGSGLSTAQLVLSIIMWRASRGRPVRVIIERDGQEVPVDTDDPGEAEAIAAKVEAS